MTSLNSRPPSVFIYILTYYREAALHREVINFWPTMCQLLDNSNYILMSEKLGVKCLRCSWIGAKPLEKPIVTTRAGWNVHFHLHTLCCRRWFMKSPQWVSRFRKMTEEKCLKPEDWRAADRAKSSKRHFSELFKYICKTYRGWQMYFLCGLPSAHWHMYSETVHSLKDEHLRKWPQLSPRNRPTHSRDASIEFVVMMERGWQWPDLETLLPRRPLEGPKAAVDSQLMPFG